MCEQYWTPISPEVGKEDSLKTSKQTEEIRAILEEISVYFSRPCDEIKKRSRTKT